MPLRPASVRAAFELLTRLPVPAATDWRAEDTVDGAAAYPLVGLALGFGLGAVAGLLAWCGLTPALQAAGLVLAGLLATGALHEDGLADAMDGLFGGWTPERRLEIMRDSRVGTYGALALVWAVGARAAALLALPTEAWPLALLVSGTAARWGGLGLLATHRYARPDATSVAAQVVNGVGLRHLAVGSVFLLPPLAAHPVGTTGALLLCCAVGLAWSTLCRAKVGGMTGDLLGGGILLMELVALVWLGLLAG